MPNFILFIYLFTYLLIYLFTHLFSYGLVSPYYISDTELDDRQNDNTYLLSVYYMPVTDVSAFHILIQFILAVTCFTNEETKLQIS